ncbi:MAG: D-Ala-D-Ala carboxypeptidase family metallohydrolase [Rhizobiaceae bacterium]
MKAVGVRKRVAVTRILAATAIGLFVSACTTGSVPPLELALESVSETQTLEDNGLSSGQTVTPDTLASSSSADQSAAEPAVTETVKAETAEAPADVAETAEQKVDAEQTDSENAATMAAADEEAAKPTAQVKLVEAARTEKKNRFLSSLWSPKPRVNVPAAKPTENRLVVASASPAPAKKKKIRAADLAASGGALPGVRDEDQLFEISRKSGLDDNSDIDINENEGAYRVASAAGLARLAPNGLLTQREGVDVACLKPALVRVLKKVERHYGKRVVVTSGYRSPTYNRRARGARNSLHMYCAAADVQVEGVTKWELAKYLRSMPGRGGVGTYCHTKSVHVDVGPERDWNWRCRRRKRRG